MTLNFRANMAEVVRLTRAGRLSDAVSVLQNRSPKPAPEGSETSDRQAGQPPLGQGEPSLEHSLPGGLRKLLQHLTSPGASPGLFKRPLHPGPDV